MHSYVVELFIFGVKLFTSKVMVSSFDKRKWRQLLNSEKKMAEMLCNHFTFSARETWYLESSAIQFYRDLQFLWWRISPLRCETAKF